MPQINPRNSRTRRALNPTAVKFIMTTVTIMGGIVAAALVGIIISAVTA